MTSSEAAAGAHETEQKATMERNLEIARAYMEGFLGAGDMGVGDRVLSPDIAVTTGLSPTGPIVGLEAYKEVFQRFRDAFPPQEPLEVIDLFATEDRAVARFRSVQRHEKAYFGLEPTGRTILLDETHVMRIEGGRVVENVVSATNLEFEMLMAPILAPMILK